MKKYFFKKREFPSRLGPTYRYRYNVDPIGYGGVESSQEVHVCAADGPANLVHCNPSRGNASARGASRQAIQASAGYRNTCGSGGGVGAVAVLIYRSRVSLWVAVQVVVCCTNDLAASCQRDPKLQTNVTKFGNGIFFLDSDFHILLYIYINALHFFPLFL